MQKMKPEYAQKLLEGSYVFGNVQVSCHDGLLVIEDRESYLSSYSTAYYGTQMKNGQFQLDDQGFVVFTEVEPVIDEHTRFSL